MNEYPIAAAMPGSDLEAALAECAAEPIRVPGAIQPHGVLLTLRGAPLRIEQASANCATLTGRTPEALLGIPLSELLSPHQTHAVTRAYADPGFIDSEPMHLRIGAGVCTASLHRAKDLLIIELEPFVSTAQDQSRIITRVLRNLQAAATLEALYEISVHEIQALTGYDRVLIYRFEPSGHGKVVGEALYGTLPSYSGLYFPGSDIPIQARELYRLNWIRVIPDATYSPVPMVPVLRPDTGQPLDLGFSILRSVSPVHCEYLKNMGVRSSMSISLIEQDELWGLISCGHPSPLPVSREVRDACALIGQLLSVQIASIIAARHQHEREDKVSTLARLALAMNHADQDVFDGLTERPEDLQLLTRAQGAAVLIENRLQLFGQCPTDEEVRALHQWIRDIGLPRQALSTRMSGLQGLGVFHTDSIQRENPAFGSYRHLASGVIAFILPKPVDNAVLWFRPQVNSTMNWSGNPEQHVSRGTPGSASHRLHPRQSFDVWEEQILGIAEFWSQADLYACEDLRRSALENDLERQVQREQEAVRQRDELVAVVSHDLRNPMSIIIMQCGMMQRWAATGASPESQRMRRALSTIEMATTRMDSLLEDLLDTAKIDAGRYQLALVPLDVTQLLEEACSLLVTLTTAKHIELDCAAEAGLRICADPERIFQVLSNLVGNAIKFTADGGRIRIHASRHAGDVQFEVRDNGAGITRKHLPHIFERYWSVKEGNPQGSGLGLYICHGIVTAHKGRLWAESEPGAGTVLTFSLPLYEGPANVLQASALKQHRRQPAAVIGDSVASAAPASQSVNEAARRAILLNELNHRVKNTLATVQAIAALTASNSDSLAAFRKSFDSRIFALSQAHDALARTEWVSTQLRELIDQARAPYGGEARVTFCGDEVTLEPRTSLTLSMVFHELMANAAQHGALSQPQGRVAVTSVLSRTDTPNTLKIEWIESRGPPVTARPGKGFGSRLIHRSIERELKGVANLQFTTTGLHCSLLIPLPDSLQDIS